MNITEQEYRATLNDDPGSPVFIELADLLYREGRMTEAVEICLGGLTANPSAHRGRLLLARFYYEKGYLPFAVQEVEKLTSALPQNEELAKLLQKLAPGSKPSVSTAQGNPASSEKTLAEAEFDLGDIELIDEEKKLK